ncbi:hypothetical protein [Paraburkholderia hospita]|nr:hypothetical protein [Paraburkholderia hospita]SEI21990.1 hypothetical protein SAMN05192544_104213 [Paraburkholderia hospita]
MTAESNKLLMFRFLEFINTANEALADELTAATQSSTSLATLFR